MPVSIVGSYANSTRIREFDCKNRKKLRTGNDADVWAKSEAGHGYYYRQVH